MFEGANRKDSHLEICLNDDVEFSSGGFSGLRFDHDALPEVDLSQISLTCHLFGRMLRAPLVIGAMTGGTARAGEINRRLALAAEATGIGLALGSQRPMIDNPDCRASFDVRAHAPGLPLLIGNVGAVQLNSGVTGEVINDLVAAIGCDVFALHLNPLQEAIQPEGDTNFAGLLARLQVTVPEIMVPVIVKEVGAGISITTARKIATLPVAGVETAGVGGTSWSAIESRRTSNPVQRSTGERFAQWGIPTVESIVACRSTLPHLTIIASGGLRTGIEAAKAIALGADAAAFALPMLKAADESVEAVIFQIERIVDELRTVMFLTGCLTVSDLKSRVLRHVVDLAC